MLTVASAGSRLCGNLPGTALVQRGLGGVEQERLNYFRVLR